MAAKGNSAPAIKGANGAPIAIEMLPIDELVPYDKNPRSHPPSQIAKLAGSIKEFGFIVPCVIDKDNVIVAGHGRLLGAKEAGLRIAPCIRAEHLSPAQIKAFRLQDNRSAQDSDWLSDLLKDELTALQGLDFDLSLTGFDDREIQNLLVDDAELARAEETPPLPENPVTVKGDVWLLGKHRLVCGDSTVATDVDKALNGVKPHLCVTDPPYGVNYDPDWRNRSALGWSQSRSTGTVKNDDRADWTDAYSLFPGDVIYVWHPAGARQVEFYNSLIAAGFDIRMQIIWAKPHFPVGRGNYHVQHEPCWYAVRKKSGATAHWQGDRKQTTLWKIDNFSAFGGNKAEGADEKTGHGTQKPIECMRRPILNNSSPGQAVYEPFSGSFTTGMACELTDRACHAIELSENYVDVGVMRWQQFTSQQATLEGDGRTFDEIKALRHGKDKAA